MSALSGQFDTFSLKIKGEKKVGSSTEAYEKTLTNEDFEKDSSGGFKNEKIKVPYGTYKFYIIFKKGNDILASTIRCLNEEATKDKVEDVVLDSPKKEVSIVACKKGSDTPPTEDDPTESSIEVSIEVVE